MKSETNETIINPDTKSMKSETKRKTRTQTQKGTTHEVRNKQSMNSESKNELRNKKA